MLRILHNKDATNLGYHFRHQVGGSNGLLSIEVGVRIVVYNVRYVVYIDQYSRVKYHGV